MDSPKTSKAYAIIMFRLALGQIVNPWIMRWLDNHTSPAIDTHFYAWVTISLLTAGAFVWVGILNLRASSATTAMVSVAKSPSTGEAVTSKVVPQKFSFRVLEAIAGHVSWNQKSMNTDLFLRLRIVNQQSPPSTFRETEWNLQLEVVRCESAPQSSWAKAS